MELLKSRKRKDYAPSIRSFYNQGDRAIWKRVRVLPLSKGKSKGTEELG